MDHDGLPRLGSDAGSGARRSVAVTFVLCLRDLAMTVHPPGVETLPIRVYALMANSSTSVTAELALLMVALTLAVMLVAGVAVAVARRVTAWS